MQHKTDTETSLVSKSAPVANLNAVNRLFAARKEGHKVRQVQCRAFLDAEIDEVYLGEGRFDKEHSTILNPESDHKKHRPRFRFSMVNIPIGAVLTFIPTGIEVKVADDDHVEYEGRIYKLSPFVGTFMPEEKRNASGAYQGAKYFTYKGEILDNLRTKLEKAEHE